MHPITFTVVDYELGKLQSFYTTYYRDWTTFVKLRQHKVDWDVFLEHAVKFVEPQNYFVQNLKMCLVSHVTLFTV